MADHEDAITCRGELPPSDLTISREQLDAAKQDPGLKDFLDEVAIVEEQMETEAAKVSSVGNFLNSCKQAGATALRVVLTTDRSELIRNLRQF